MMLSVLHLDQYKSMFRPAGPANANSQCQTNSWKKRADGPRSHCRSPSKLQYFIQLIPNVVAQVLAEKPNTEMAAPCLDSET
jgi:hypothetical protein